MFPLVRLTTNCSTALTGKTSRRTPPTSSTRPFNPLRMTPTSNATWTLDRTSPIPTSAAIWPPHPRSRLSPRRLPLPAFQSIPASHSSQTASALHKCAGPHSGGSPPCKALRLHQIQPVLRTGHRHIQQPPLFLYLLGAARRHVGRDAAVDHIQDIDDVPLLALGRMNGRQDEEILVEERIAGEVARGFRWVERQVGQERLTGIVEVLEVFERLEIGDTRPHTLVQALEMRLVPFSYERDLPGPFRSAAKRRQ